MPLITEPQSHPATKAPAPAPAHIHMLITPIVSFLNSEFQIYIKFYDDLMSQISAEKEAIACVCVHICIYGSIYYMSGSLAHMCI